MPQQENKSNEEGANDQAADEAPQRRLAAAHAGHLIHVLW
jgi:hypothetical protein